MPFRWKLYNIINYFFLIPHAFLLGLIIGDSPFAEPIADNPEPALIGLSLIAFVIVPLFNIFIFHRYTPSRRIQKPLKLISFGLCLVFSLALMWWVYMILHELTIFSSEVGGSWIIFVFPLVFITAAFGIYIIWGQLALPVFIDKNQPQF